MDAGTVWSRGKSQVILLQDTYLLHLT